MAHILCMTSGLTGLLNASFEMVRRLRDDGHRVTYACPQDVRHAVRAQGIDYIQLGSVNFDPAPPAPGGRIFARFTRKPTSATRRVAGVAALGMDAFRKTLADLAPDLVLIDSELYEHIFTLYAMGTPHVLVSPFFAQWPGRGLPPLATAFLPDNASAIDAHIANRAEQIQEVSDKNLYTERRSVLLEYARSVNYPVDALEQHAGLTMFVNTRQPTLLLTAQELDFEHRVPEHVHYVGPMVSEQRVETSVSKDDQVRLDAVLNNLEGPLIYCPLSTMDVGDNGLATHLIRAVTSQPDWTLIIAGAPADAALPTAPNVHVFGYVAQTDVLPRVSACVTLAGMNTVHEALLADVPLLAYPMHYDQPGVAARLESKGLALVGKPDDDASVIASRLQTLMNDQPLRSRLAGYRDMLVSYAERRVLENAITASLVTR
ncbi:MAG: hypothetical protein AAF610_04315 [Pseudomonadota bacterium]